MDIKKKVLQGNLGFTLIEVIVAMAICGLLGTGVVTGIYHIGRVNAMGNARVTAVKQLENAVYYLNRDIQMSQNIQAHEEDFWLDLTWNEWEQNNVDEVIYRVEDGVLTRSFYINETLINEKPVASNITAYLATPPDLEASPPEKAWTLEITAQAASGHREESETRRLEIIPRPGS